MPESEFLTVSQVSATVGVGRSTVKAWIAQGVLPSVKLGRARRVSRRQLDEFINRAEREGSVPSACPHSRERVTPATGRKAGTGASTKRGAR